MIKICPAILTSDITEFERELKLYSEIFDFIDIDVNVKVDNFKGKVTVPIEKFLPLIEEYKETFFNIHLMTEFPLEEIKKTVNSSIFKNLRFIIHQESRVDKQVFSLLGRNSLAATLEVESNLQPLSFYNQYSEVQLMTVDVGYQGTPFQLQVLEKSKELKKLGFSGVVSIDGGVNLETAKEIKKYPIDRVSVGSYFSKSKNITEDFEILNHALNKA